MKENCFVVWDEADGTAVLIDPGCGTQPELDELEAFLDGNGLHPAAILVTHLHFDHVAGADALCRRYNIACHACAADRELAMQVEEMARIYGVAFESSKEAFRFFDMGEQQFRFGTITVQVLPIGGHTEGSVAYYFPGAEAVFVGDTVVKGSLGFLETGFRETLEHIRDHLLPLPDGTRMFSGHGEASTIGEEKQENRFFKRSGTLA
jgi:glyoxylase-like metal-dependent hydrolase (beta-lactamase superfamily II)